MSEFLGDAERAALRGVAYLLPARWRQIVDVVAAPIPPTPSGTIPAPADAAAARLEGVEHIVVVMLENRSFDHMLGYLSLPGELGGKGRATIDGLRGTAENVNDYNGRAYPIHHLAQTAFAGEAEDPDHSGRSVDEQLAGGGKGFVANFARISAARAAKRGVPAPNPGLVMGYYDADDLPVYDHLATEYCVVDRWFSSVPGATWPNRLYSVTGRAAGSRDDVAVVGWFWVACATVSMKSWTRTRQVWRKCLAEGRAGCRVDRLYEPVGRRHGSGAGGRHEKERGFSSHAPPAYYFRCAARPESRAGDPLAAPAPRPRRGLGRHGAPRCAR